MKCFLAVWLKGKYQGKIFLEISEEIAPFFLVQFHLFSKQ